MRGRVQGVGFRPTVWRIARDLGLSGEVLNDAEGVLVRVGGSERSVAAFIERMEREPPPLGRIDRIETQAILREPAASIPHCRECWRRRAYANRPGRCDLHRLRRGDQKSVRAPFPLPVHQLHALRTASEHRQRHSV